jgi:hypothetical protein
MVFSASFSNISVLLVEQYPEKTIALSKAKPE